MSASFDEPNLVAAAGMAAGADSIDNMAILRHGGMKRLFNSCYAPATLGYFLRSFTFGHVRQLDAVASRFLGNLANKADLLGSRGSSEFVFVDVDDTIREVHGYQKQGSGCGAKRLVADSPATLGRVQTGSPVLCRFDSAYYGHAPVSAALDGGADVSVTSRMDPAVKRAISSIPADAWKSIEYTDAVFDETAGTWISKAEVAETPLTAFTSRIKSEQVTRRLVVRRIPELNPKVTDGQPAWFEAYRFHAFFTPVDAAVMDTLVADKTHRTHAITEQVNADLKNSALAHLPSGHFGANSAWLATAVMAYNLTRAAGLLAAGKFGRARTATIRANLVNVPARIASSTRRIRLHLPESWS